MNTKWFVRHVVLSMALFAACGPARAFPPPMSTPEGEWSVKLVQTGGFAGVNLVVRVSSEGQLTAEDLRSGRAVSQTLPDETLRELHQLLAQTALPASEQAPSPCADCFIYELEITSDAGTVRVQADDTNLSQSGAQMLVEFLGRVRDQALRSSI